MKWWWNGRPTKSSDRFKGEEKKGEGAAGRRTGAEGGTRTATKQSKQSRKRAIKKTTTTRRTTNDVRVSQQKKKECVRTEHSTAKQVYVYLWGRMESIERAAAAVKAKKCARAGKGQRAKGNSHSPANRAASNINQSIDRLTSFFFRSAGCRNRRVCFLAPSQLGGASPNIQTSVV